MLHMVEMYESPLLSSEEMPAAQILNGAGSAPALLVCEHASRFVPAVLDGLGLDPVAAALTRPGTLGHWICQ